ncbi:hypothetical protein ACNJKD_14370 [Edwardsiella tarda]|uniref:hypothetical protein n=1 Tax=Edwardsiella tarda TaxID=636 RepID=UPI003A87C463
MKRDENDNLATVSTDSPSPKPTTSFVPGALTPSEIASLQRDKREAHQYYQKLLETVDLSHLM